MPLIIIDEDEHLAFVDKLKKEALDAIDVFRELSESNRVLFDLKVNNNPYIRLYKECNNHITSFLIMSDYVLAVIKDLFILSASTRVLIEHSNGHQLTVNLLNRSDINTNKLTEDKDGNYILTQENLLNIMFIYIRKYTKQYK